MSYYDEHIKPKMIEDPRWKALSKKVQDAKAELINFENKFIAEIAYSEKRETK